MKIIPRSEMHHFAGRAIILLIVVALISLMTGCESEGEGGGDGYWEYYELTIYCPPCGGSVIEPGEGTHTYAADTTVNLTAEADEHYRFVAWDGDVDTITDVNAAATNITMNSDYFVTPIFIPENPPENLKIRTWYDLDAIRYNVGGDHTLMNDLDSTTAGYEELASPTANQGKGWQPLVNQCYSFWGTLDGQGHKIRDLFISRPDEMNVGLFGFVDQGATIENIGVVTATVTGDSYVGGLVGNSYGTVSNSSCTGSVTGNSHVGGLVGWNEYGTVSDSFWDTETSGQATSAGGTGKTTAEMKDITTFSGAMWDIIAVANPGTRNPSYIWNIVDAATYPFLSWQPV